MPVFKALYKFAATDSTDLELLPGDLVDVSKVDPGEWGMGVSRTSKKKGAFPWTYVQEVVGVAPAAAPPPVSRASKPNATPAAASGGQSPQKAYENVPVGGIKPAPVLDSAPPPARAPRGGSTAGAPRVMNNPGYDETPVGDPALQAQSWFAGKMERDTAKEAITGHPDGTFLIRASSRHDGYSLSVMFLDQCRHVKVLKDAKGHFGFTQPCEYTTITAFVEHFQAVSLSVYNAELETKLVHPYKTAPKATVASTRNDDFEEDIYGTKREALKAKMTEKSTGHYAKGRVVAYYSTEVNALAKTKKSQEAVVKMFKEQLLILEQGKEKVRVDADSAKINANMATIRSKKVDAERELEAIVAQLEVARSKEDSKAGSEAKAAAVEKKDIPLAQIKPIPDEGTSDFYVGTANRAQAEKLLSGKKSGVYLVRKSDRPKDPYTLSLKLGPTKTKHIQVKYDGLRFGLADPLAFYSLEGLCMYYQAHAISPSIPIMLANAHQAVPA